MNQDQEPPGAAPATAAAPAWYPLAGPGAAGHIGSNAGKVIDIRYPGGRRPESILIAGVSTVTRPGAVHDELDLAAGTRRFIRKEPDRPVSYVQGRSLRDRRLAVEYVGEGAVPGAAYQIAGGTPPGTAMAPCSPP